MEEGVEMAKIFEKPVLRMEFWVGLMVMVISVWDILWPERLYIPEPPNPLPKDLDWSHHGAGAHIPIAAALTKVVSVPILV